ncbi:MAG TPA: 50S ribosomal protein L11 methyltransferase [Burkholderiaceae bacterium]|nr:50S ribosomal protein L11 methyltransferase [Burkholderiaceae bacterium]
MWHELIFVVADGQAEAWSDALLDCGALSVQAEDADEGSPDEQALFGEPGEPAPALGWQRTRLTALVDVDTDCPQLLAQAAARCGAAAVPAGFELREVPEQDWVRATQAQFEPIPIGRRLLITPSWHLQAVGACADGQAIDDAGHRQTIVLDPGLAFGTGSHPTTRMCLEWLDANLRTGDTLIDYGCGSGILAIAAARLGASRVVAIDIDPQAVESTRDNAARNSVTVVAREPAGSPLEAADVVVANILANPLRVLAPLLGSLVRPHGHLVLAGLLDRQADEIAACYPRFDLRPWRTTDGWTCLAGPSRS